MPHRAIYPGTFDPITIGHLDIINRASHVVDELFIGVACNGGKGPIFSLEERLDMVEREVRDLDIHDRCKVHVKPFKSLLIDFAKENQATLIIRGIRAVSDFEYEFQMAAMNKALDSSLETVFLMASEHCQFISSKLIKEIVTLGGDVGQFVSPDVNDQLRAKL